MRAMDWTVSKHDPLAGFCAQDAESLGSIYKREEFLDQLNYYSIGMQLTTEIIFIQG
jgi:hypothetical protein